MINCWRITGLMKAKGFIFIMLAIVVAAASCGRKYLYDDIHNLPKTGWSADEKERFEFEVADTNATFLFYFHVRHKLDYRFSNLYVFMETRFPNGNIARDTLECILAEPDGRWIGKGYGRLKENLILLNPTLKFPLKGKYTLDIQHAMREEELKGLTDIGIRIEPNQR